MALRAGYYGLKRNVKHALENLAGEVSGMKIIKSFADSFSLSSAGKLNLLSATASRLGGIKVGDGLTIENGVLSAVSIVQVDTFPEASAENAGQIRQYIGASNANYTNGFFYKSRAVEEKKNPVMTSNTEPSGEASASSSYSDPARPAWYAFDNSDSTYWTSAANEKVGAYIQYEFAEATVITGVKTKNTPEATYKSIMKSYKVQGSLDGTVFTDLAIVTDNPFTTSYENVVLFDNSTAYKYYRIVCTDTWTEDPANSVGFANIDFMGPTDSYSWSKINVQ